MSGRTVGSVPGCCSHSNPLVNLAPRRGLGAIVSERAVKHVRRFLGQRLRSVRTKRGFSQKRLGQRASLSGKFVGEVERGEKSISIDSLFRIAVALEVPLRELTNVPAATIAPGPEAERLLAFVGALRSRASLASVYEVLRALFPERRRRAGRVRGC